MENKPKFSVNDQNSYEIVRGVVFEILRRGEMSQFPRDFEYFSSYVELDKRESNAKEKFLNLSRNVIWDLIIQRIVTPGLNYSNPDLPFFSLTEYGRKILQDEGASPYDPERYWAQYKEIMGDGIDQIVLRYLKESLDCFYSGCYLSASMILGIASERVFLGLCSELCSALKSATEKTAFEKILDKISMLAKVDFVKRKIQDSSIPKDLKSKINTMLLGIVELLRIQRNDIGHPQDNLRVLNREEVYVYFRLFLSYSTTIRDFLQYLKNNTI